MGWKKPPSPFAIGRTDAAKNRCKRDFWQYLNVKIAIAKVQRHAARSGGLECQTKCRAFFVKVLAFLLESFLSSTSAECLHRRCKNTFLEFDKDDNDALDFVTSASNLRSLIFDIPCQSRFEVKCELCIVENDSIR